VEALASRATAVQISNTPNHNALRLTVGSDVGGPATFVAESDVDDPTAAALLGLPGVTGVFMTADFVTLSKTPDAPWDLIVDQASAILGERFAA